MRYEEFKSQFVKNMETKLEGEAKVHTKTVHKTNVELDGLTAEFADSHIQPQIYINNAYKDYEAGMPMDETVEKYTARLKNAYENRPAYSLDFSVEEAKEHLGMALVNYEANKEMLKECPYELLDGGDIAAVPRWYLDDDASIQVTKYFAKNMKLLDEEVIDMAKQNNMTADYKVQSMNEIMAGMMRDQGMDEEFIKDMMPDTPNLIVVANENNVSGAAVILNDEAMQSVSEKLDGDDFYILPSSRFEVICISENDVSSVDELKNMVESVNDSDAIKPEDYLSDNVYHYDAKAHELTMATSDMDMDHEEQDIQMDEPIESDYGMAMG